MRTLRKGTSNTKSLAHITPVRPILEYGAACWDPYRESQICELDRVHRKLLSLLTSQIIRNREQWPRVGRLYEAYCGERVWKDVGGRLERPQYWNRTGHSRKLGAGGRETDIRKYSFVNRTIEDWNRLPAEGLEHHPPSPPVHLISF